MNTRIPNSHRDDSRPEESPRNYSKKETTDQTVTSTGKVARPVPPTTTFKAQPLTSRGGRFQEEELDSKPPAVPHFLHQDDKDNFHDDDWVDFHNTEWSLAMASGTPAYQPATPHTETPISHDIETAMDRIEPLTTTTEQAPVRPGAFREGGGFQDDEDTLFTAPEQYPVPPSQSSTPDNVIAEAELVGDEPRLVVANVAQEKWWTKPRNVRILIAAVVLLLVLLGVLGAVMGISGGGRSSEGDNVDVENDVCEDAISLIIPSSVQGSTMNAASDVRLPCGKSSPGVWYSILGMGNTITASLCNEDTTFDTYLAVFSVDCSRLECVVENDDGDGDSCGGKSDVSWKATDGVAYYVLVHGASSSAIGDFRLDISQADPVENNVCADGIALSIPSSVEGSTMNAGSDASLPCGKNTPGVWYSIVGTGNTITASLCNEDTTFDTNLAVFSGSCGSLECVVENEDGGDDTCGVKSRVSWVATDGETYSVLVHGASSSAIGDFHLDISEIDGNDLCEDAISLSIPSSIEGSTINSTLDDVGADTLCEPYGPGIWYTVVGTGSNIIASTCNNVTSYDTQISVFHGGCSGLQCVAHNDYGGLNSCYSSSGSRSRAVWTSIEGETYSVLVHGTFGDSIGDFRLDISQVDPVENDVCEDAIPLSILLSVEGSTIDATLNDVGAGTPCEPYVPGIWYTVVGTGNNIIASTCNNVTSYDTQISVFLGGCSGLQCVAFNSWGPESLCDSSSGSRSRAVWTSVRGETYSVLVHGRYSFSIGNFRLDISQVDPVENDVCEDATPLSIPASVEGSTMHAGHEYVGTDYPCEPYAPGIWYTVVGTGNNIIASTCNEDTSYDTKISVFRGGCSDLQCVAHNDHGPVELCASASVWTSRVVWTSVRGETYSVLVHGFFREVGDFRLDLSQVDPVENDVCEDAIPLPVPSSIEGSTTNATLDDVGANTTCEPYVPGIWYTVVGTGNNIIASTCNNVTSYDTAISVFLGGCSGLQCVAHNDYGPDSLCDSSSGSRSRAVWTSIEGETYSILVHGRYSFRIGDFRLDISQVDPVENDVCEDAIPLAIPSSVEGSTINAGIDAGLPCGYSTPGVWYSVVGTGNNITASLCNEDTTFDTYLAVFSGSCGSLECVVENLHGGDSCGGEYWFSRVSWTATGGVTYYVLVQGYWSESIGDFRLDIS